MKEPFISETRDIPESASEDAGGKYYYIQTDFKVINLLPDNKKIYGDGPFVYYKYVKSPGSNNFVRKTTQLWLKTTLRGAGSFAMTFDLLGLEDSISQLCGKTTVKQVAYSALGWEVNPYTGQTNYSKPITVTRYKQGDAVELEAPKLGRAGLINMAYQTRQRSDFSEGTAGSGGYTFDSFGAGVGISVGTAAVYSYNLSSAKLIEQWNEYIEYKNKYGDSDTTKSKQLRFRDKFGQSGVVDNFDDFQRLFPKNFLIAGENLSSSLLKIVGNNKFVRIDSTNNFYPESYVGLWQKFAAEGLSEKAVVERLLSTGYTQAQINATRSASGLSTFNVRQFAYNAFSESALVLAPLSGTNNPNNPTPGGGSTNGNGGAGGGAQSPNGSAWAGPEGYEPGVVQSITVGRSRNSFVTSDNLSSIITADPSRQVMYQVYASSIENDGTPNYIVEQYPFDFSPNDINYSGLAGEWQSIERSGSFPIIDWKSFKLLQISFSFLIANKNGQLTADGLDIPVTNQIEKLQRMAQKPYPVVFYGFDTLLTNQFRYDSSGRARGIQFVIQDLSITSQRRNERMEITRAQATITLQEIPIETTNIIGMPRLEHKNITPPKPPVPPTDPEYALFVKSLTVQAPNSITWVN